MLKPWELIRKNRLLRMCFSGAALVAMVAVSSPAWSGNYSWSLGGSAPDARKYPEFSQLISEIKDMMLTHCRKRGNVNATGIYGPLSDANAFRQACGQGLNGKDTPTRPWKFFYTQEGNQTGTTDVIGIQRLVEVNGQEGSLVLGWQTKRSQPHQQPEISSGQAMAVLFVGQDGAWQPVWSYVNEVKNEWNRPWDWNPEDVNWTDWTVSNLEAVWGEYVTSGSYSFVRNVKDARGIGFP